MMKRSVAVVTTSRADYSHLYWVLRELDRRPALEPRLLVTGAHLAGEFGSTVGEIEGDGFRIDERIECLLDSDSDIGMAKTIGVATLALAEVLGRMRPDLLLLIADRYELLAPATVALALRIPVAHIEGGEVSEGAIDDAVRNAVTKMSHIHFTPTESAKQRLLGMGEESWRVHRVGAPSLDHLHRSELIPPDRLVRELGVELDCPTILVAYHPVTILRDTLREMDQLFAALEGLSEQLLFCFPNADAGGRELIRRTELFCARHARSKLFVNLNPRAYWSLLRSVSLMLGNSSSGIMETPSLEIPCVNVGLRQQGRERAANIIDVAADADAIIAGVRRGLDAAYRESLRGMSNPYGDGRAAERIADVLEAAPPAETLILKRAVRLDGCGPDNALS